MLHILWGKAKDSPETYVKQEWMTLQAQMEALEAACRDAQALLRRIPPWQLPASAGKTLEKLDHALLLLTH